MSRTAVQQDRSPAKARHDCIRSYSQFSRVGTCRRTPHRWERPVELVKLSTVLCALGRSFVRPSNWDTDARNLACHPRLYTNTTGRHTGPRRRRTGNPPRDHERKSSPISSAGGLCVIQPTEIKSTPVAAIAGAVAGVTRPDASVIARPATISTAERSSSFVMLSSKTASAPIAKASSSWTSVSTSTSILTR